MSILPLFALALALSGAPAQDSRAAAELFVRPLEGAHLRAAIRVRIDPGWHLYHSELGQPDSVGKPTVVSFPEESVLEAQVRFPEPHRFEQPGIGEKGRDTWIWGHEGEIVIHALLRVAEGADAATLQAKLSGLTCQDDGSCIPWSAKPRNGGPGPDALFEAFPVDLAPGKGGAAPANGGASDVGIAAVEPEADAVDWDAVTYPEYTVRERPSERGLGMWLLFAFLAGVILNVMPCVLPVVSIKILSFVQQAGESRARIFQLGLSFSAGILAVFLGLAAAAAFAGKGWGEQFQSQEFLVVMIAIVFGFSLSLFDVFEIGVPDQVGSLAAQRREGLGDAFFKGMMATVLATPCSGPFLGSTLAWALTQPASVVFLIFTFVGLGMAAPYVLLTANPGFLKFVPKPGAWMQTFKHLMGFLLLGTVIFLMVSLRQDLHVYTVAFLVFVGLACWIWGRFATFDQSRLRRLGTVATVLLVLSLGAQASFVTLRNFFAGPGEGAGHLEWEDFDPVKLQRYHDEGRSVFVDFTADWCLTCKMNEKLVYETEEVVARLKEKNVVAMRADETDDSPKTAAIARLRESLGARSIPFMAIFPGDDWRNVHTAKDVVTRSQFLGLLDRLP
jgi:thiol:disulfide interchange protein